MGVQIQTQGFCTHACGIYTTFSCEGLHDLIEQTSASSRLRSGVADFGNCWETAGHKEVSHEQEVRGPAVGGRADGLSGDHQDSQGIVAAVSSCSDPAQGRCRWGRV